MPFVKGQSGNPTGKPKGMISLVTIIKQKLRAHPEEAGAIIAALFERAKSGDVKAIEICLERVDGKVTQTYGGDPANPLVFLTHTPGMKGKE